MSRRRPLIVGVGGTLRIGSTSERTVRLALAAAAGMGADTRLFTGPDVNLPPLRPSDPTRTPESTAFVEALRQADGVILSSPGYHGSISGMLKNAIDYTEDLRGDARIYLSDRAVGAIVCANGIQGLCHAATGLLRLWSRGSQSA